MATRTLCDIEDCQKEGRDYRLDYVQITVESTGKSDYSAELVERMKSGRFDLCEEHADEYDKRLKNVLVHDEKGLRFPDES